MGLRKVVVGVVVAAALAAPQAASAAGLLNTVNTVVANVVGIAGLAVPPVPLERYAPQLLAALPNPPQTFGPATVGCSTVVVGGTVYRCGIDIPASSVFCGESGSVDHYGDYHSVTGCVLPNGAVLGCTGRDDVFSSSSQMVCGITGVVSYSSGGDGLIPHTQQSGISAGPVSYTETDVSYPGTSLPMTSTWTLTVGTTHYTCTNNICTLTQG